MSRTRILVISTYPKKGTISANRHSAVAGYTRNTLESMDMAAAGGIEWVVLADVLDEPGTYTEGSREVIRCWRRNDWFVYPKLLARVLRSHECKKILMAFEFGMFGNRKILIGLFPFFIMLLRLVGRKVYLVSHGVITDAGEVSGQLGLKRRSPIVRLYGVMLRSIYRLIVFFSNRTVVFEPYLREKLVAAVNTQDEIIAIPHGVQRRHAWPKRRARERLGLDGKTFIVMCFGYLIWYKGTDWLADNFARYVKQNPWKNLRLILAGDTSSVHGSDPVYRSYAGYLRELVDRSEHVEITGFLKEEEVDLYFSASDLLVMPYRVFISASGPFSLAVAHRKPFLLSSRLQGYLKSGDFREAVARAGLHRDDPYFDLDYDSFRRKLDETMGNKKRLERLSDVSAFLFKNRNWENVGRMYHSAVIRGDGSGCAASAESLIVGGGGHASCTRT
jgi:glycosyltransferase involved in cell wall biosynthesis